MCVCGGRFSTLCIFPLGLVALSILYIKNYGRGDKFPLFLTFVKPSSISGC